MWVLWPSKLTNPTPFFLLLLVFVLPIRSLFAFDRL